MERRFTIRIEDQGTRFDCLDGDRLLHAMERQGIDCIPVGCRNGGCGLCLIQIVDGDYRAGPMSSRHVSPQSRACGYVLACRVYPQSSITARLATSSERLAVTTEQ